MDAFVYVVSHLLLYGTAGFLGAWIARRTP